MSITANGYRQMTILVAEDDEEDRMLLEEAFEEADVKHQLRFVYDGEEVFDYLHHRGRFESKKDNPSPGLIVLDLNMPKKDGREVLDLLRSKSAFKSIPVVIMTTSSALEDIAFTYEHGANSFITKPTLFKDLLAAVKNLKNYWFDTVVLPAPNK